MTVNRGIQIGFAVVVAALIALVVALVLALGGGDAEERPTGPAPAGAPGGSAAPPSAGGLPPGIAECLADQGFDLASPTDLHSAPPGILQACFDVLHQGSGGP